MEKKAWAIWKHLDKTKQGFCFDELGVIWDIAKCKAIIDENTRKLVKRGVREAQELHWAHHIK